MDSSQPTRAASRSAAPTIAALLTRPEAYAIAVVIAEQVAEHAKQIADNLEDGASGLHVFEIDAQAHCRRLMPLVSTLEQIGWPHAHAWPECDRTLTREEEDYSPWEASNVIAARREEARRERTAPVNGDTLLAEIRDTLDRRVPDLPTDDPTRPYLAGLLDALRTGLSTTINREDDA